MAVWGHLAGGGYNRKSYQNPSVLLSCNVNVDPLNGYSFSCFAIHVYLVHQVHFCCTVLFLLLLPFPGLT